MWKYWFGYYHQQMVSNISVFLSYSYNLHLYHWFVLVTYSIQCLFFAFFLVRCNGTGNRPLSAVILNLKIFCKLFRRKYLSMILSTGKWQLPSHLWSATHMHCGILFICASVQVVTLDKHSETNSRIEVVKVSLVVEKMKYSKE